MRHQRMLHIIPIWACPIWMCLGTIAALTARPEALLAANANVFTHAECLRIIDKSISRIDEVDIDTAQQGLATLAQSCEGVPQIHHNLGVIAARRGQWETAVSAFERAIALAPQTADTVAQLKSIHEYQAKKAWQVALELEDAVVEPVFTWQTSSDENRLVSAAAPNRKGLRSVATVDFELYTWWHALDENDAAEWQDHYVNGYPAPTIDKTRPVSWEAVTREIQFTASDAAVVLTWTQNGTEHHRWLLLTLAGQRWQIYHEAEL